ncbi:unnamed protein product [Lactuca saligna]|uniref:Uncharacterized protein n=1 Tax=Lactuca saligna TaxID=75948 RepID=A0AA35YYA7_LACSI|nr:unnamed protein product [Lactuca saligna]
MLLIISTPSISPPLLPLTDPILNSSSARILSKHQWLSTKKRTIGLDLVLLQANISILIFVSKMVSHRIDVGFQTPRSNFTFPAPSPPTTTTTNSMYDFEAPKEPKKSGSTRLQLGLMHLRGKLMMMQMISFLLLVEALIRGF